MSYPPNPIPTETAYFGIRSTNAPNLILAKRAPNNNDKRYPLGTQWLNKVSQVEYVLVGFTNGNPVWDTGGDPLASNTTPGIVYLGTTAQTASGGAPSSSYVASSNDVAAAIAGIVVGQVPSAAGSTQGIVYLAPNSDVVSPYSYTYAANEALTPANITTIFASPPAIGSGGGSNPNSGTFTTLTSLGNASINASGSGQPQSADLLV